MEQEGRPAGFAAAYGKEYGNHDGTSRYHGAARHGNVIAFASIGGRLGRISKRGDGYIRCLLVHGARSVLRWRRAKPAAGSNWTDQLLTRRPTNVVLVAMANKTARVAWALLRYERIYQPTSA